MWHPWLRSLEGQIRIGTGVEPEPSVDVGEVVITADGPELENKIKAKEKISHFRKKIQPRKFSKKPSQNYFENF